jgi:hypothetical protein
MLQRRVRQQYDRNTTEILLLRSIMREVEISVYPAAEQDVGLAVENEQVAAGTVQLHRHDLTDFDAHF